FAQAGMLVSDTETEGRVYQMSSEHHVRHEVQVRNAAHWRFYALQTEAERGESGFDLPLEIDASRDITVANFHGYRVISSFQPFPWAIKVSDSRDIRFRNVHCYSNSKVSYDSSVYDQTHKVEVRQREFAWLDLSGRAPQPKPVIHSPVLARGAKVEQLAGGFYNISGGAAGPQGDFYFVDAHWQRIHRWDPASRQLSTISDSPLDPVNLAVDQSGNLVVVSYAGKGIVYALKPQGAIVSLQPKAVAAQAGKTFFLPVGDWRLNRESLSRPAAQFISPDGTTVLVAGADFLSGAVRAFLAFHGNYADLAQKMARAVTDHATPVGSGTVARTKRIPVEQRAEAAVIAWMRHKTTGYDGMVIPRIKGKRREVRRILARRSQELLQRYRRGEAVGEDCPLKQALTSGLSGQPDLSS